MEDGDAKWGPRVGTHAVVRCASILCPTPNLSSKRAVLMQPTSCLEDIIGTPTYSLNRLFVSTSLKQPALELAGTPGEHSNRVCSGLAVLDIVTGIKVPSRQVLRTRANRSEAHQMGNNLYYLMRTSPSSIPSCRNAPSVRHGTVIGGR